MTPNNNQNKKFYSGKKKFFGPRRNERIRGPRTIRVIGPTGNQIGVMSPMEALQMAKGCGLDLVEISPTAQPPVCRIIDYGKYMYEESKKTKAGKSTSPKLKEVKFRPTTETHDYQTKIRNAEKFLFAGNKLKVSVFMRGREMEYKDLAFELCKRAIADLAHVGVSDFPPRLAGRSVSFSMSPLPKDKRKLKYSGADEDLDIEDDSGEDFED